MSKFFTKLFTHPVTLSVLVITLVQFGSRFLGFVRQFLIWSKLDSLQSDLLLSSNKIPEFLLAFLLMGTVYSAVLPIATKLETESEDTFKLSRYLGLIFYTLNSILLVVVIFLWIFTEPLLKLFTSNELWQIAISRGLIDDYILTTRILLLIPFVSAFQSIVGVFLTMKKKFFVFSTAGVIANLGMIFGLLISGGDIVKVAISMIIGWVVVDVLFLLVATRNGFWIQGFRLAGILSDIKKIRTDFVQTWRVFLPRILILDGFYLSSFLINPIAQSKGEITAYDIGISIQSSFFILVTALGTIFFPDLSKIFLDTKFSKAAFWHKLFKYLKISLALGFFITIVTFLCSPLVIYIYSLAGKGQDNAKLIVTIAQVSSVGLIFRSAKEILAKYFYVKQSVWVPIILSTFAIFTQTVVTLTLFYKFNFDSIMAVTLGFIFNEFAWLILATYYIVKDYKLFKKDTKLSETI